MMCHIFALNKLKISDVYLCQSVEVSLYYGEMGIHLGALYELAETYLIRVLGESNFCAIHDKCLTFMPHDIHLA